jgi:hypothetical protein
MILAQSNSRSKNARKWLLKKERLGDFAHNDLTYTLSIAELFMEKAKISIGLKATLAILTGVHETGKNVPRTPSKTWGRFRWKPSKLELEGVFSGLLISGCCF